MGNKQGETLGTSADAVKIEESLGALEIQFDLPTLAIVVKELFIGVCRTVISRNTH